MKGAHRLVIWVDDIICRGPEKETLEFYAKLGKRFEVKDPSYLGIDSKLAFVGMDISARQGEGGTMTYAIDQNSALDACFEEWRCTMEFQARRTTVGKKGNY